MSKVFHNMEIASKTHLKYNWYYNIMFTISDIWLSLLEVSLILYIDMDFESLQIFR